MDLSAFLQNKKISFKADTHVIASAPSPVPSTRQIPDWYKNMATHSAHGYENTENLDMFSNFGALKGGMTIKRCLPVQDMITAGYIIPLWADIAVDAYRDNDQLQFNWKGTTNRIENHQRWQVKGSPVENICWGDQAFKLMNPWRIHTAGGYSCLFLSPSYRESDIEILPGIVDTDRYHEINFPFRYLGGNGKKTLIRGTPVVQVIPFKREKHKMEILELTKKEKDNDMALHNSFLGGLYRKMFHTKKIYR